MDILFAAVSVKWWAIIIGIAIHFVVGMLWYGPLFGKPWMNLVGFTMEKIQANPSPLPYIGALAKAFVTTYVLGIVFNLAGTETILAAVVLGLLLWFAFTLMTLINHDLFEMRPMKLTLLNAFNNFASVLLVSIVLQLAR